MTDYKLNEHQQRAVEALRDVKRVCEKYHIRYYLISGSALGAVRNEGMIPWDDDIDLGFFYDDWLRIREILPTELDPCFTYEDHDKNPNFPRLFPKVLYQSQLCIDLFPIVKWTSCRVDGKIHWMLMKVYRAFFCFSMDYFPPLVGKHFRFKNFYWHVANNFYKIFLRFLTTSKIVNMNRKNERHYENTKTNWYIIMYGIHPMENEMINAKWLESQSLVKYEGEMYTTFGDVYAFLSHMYGDDYMTPKNTHQHTELFNI